MRRAIRNYSDDPRMQEELNLATQRNAYAAIPQLRLRQLYRNYGAMAARDRKETTDFVNRYELKDQDIAESSRRHNMSMTIRRKQLKDAIKGNEIGKILGLGSVLMGIEGNRQAAKDRQLQKEQNAFIMENYIKNANPEGLAGLWQLFPSQRENMKNTDWYKRQQNQYDTDDNWNGQE